MRIDVLTLFPEFIEIILDWSIIGRAVKDNKIEINCTNIRLFSKNKHKKVDDYPYGGGPGMLMEVAPIADAIKSLRNDKSHVIYMSPQGKVLTQKRLNQIANEKEHIIILCGHYEGIDQRVIDNYIDEELSVGDYVLTGGELPAMVLIDGLTRLVPGVLKSSSSYEDESFYCGLLEYPQYTRPVDYEGFKVPEVLLSGHHKNIEEFRLRESIRSTILKRPDLINLSEFDEKKKEIYFELLNELKNI